jgi:hypothetical protein
MSTGGDGSYEINLGTSPLPYERIEDDYTKAPTNTQMFFARFRAIVCSSLVIN